MAVKLPFSIENILKNTKTATQNTNSDDISKITQNISNKKTTTTQIGDVTNAENRVSTHLAATITHSEVYNVSLQCSCSAIVTTQFGSSTGKLKARRIGHPYKSRAPPKRKPFRNAFTHNQVLYLEALFGRTKYLSSADRLRVAKELNMTENQLKTWYQNRRTKLKRDLVEMKEQEKLHFSQENPNL